MIYRKDLFEAVGHRGPDDARRDGRRRRAAEGGQRRRRRTSRASTCPAGTGTPCCRSSGRTAATSPPRKATQWVGQLDSPESIAGLEYFKDVFDQANARARRRRRRQRLPGVLQRRGRHDAGAGLEAGPDHQPGRRLPRHGGQHRRVRHARHRRPARPRRCSSAARTSAIPANSENQDLAYDLLKIMVVARLPAAVRRGRHDPGAQVGARRASPAATPPSPRPTAAREQPLRADQREVGRRRGGQRPAGHARPRSPRAATSPRPRRTADAAIESHAQRLDSRRRRHQTPHDDRTDRPMTSLRRPHRGRRPDRRSPPRRGGGGHRRCPTSLLLPAVVVLVRDARLPARAPGHAVAAGVRPAAGVRAAGAVGRPRQLPRRSSTTPTSGPSCGAR